MTSKFPVSLKEKEKTQRRMGRRPGEDRAETRVTQPHSKNVWGHQELGAGSSLEPLKGAPPC